MALIIAPDIVIPDEELEWKFIRSSGPGGQNVNKVSSAAQLRFLLPQNASLPVNVRKSGASTRRSAAAPPSRDAANAVAEAATAPGTEDLLAQCDLQNAVPDLLREHHLRVGGHRQQRIAERQAAVAGRLNHVSSAQQVDEIAEQALVEELR